MNSQATHPFKVSHPHPGETKWEPGMAREDAEVMARSNYDVERISPNDGQPGWCVFSRGGWVAIVGMVGGYPAILHKNPDGSRTLEQYAIA